MWIGSVFLSLNIVVRNTLLWCIVYKLKSPPLKYSILLTLEDLKLI